MKPALVLVVAASLASCRAPDPTSACPAGFAADAPRTSALVEGLRKAEEGAAILARGPAAPRVCFGPAAVSVLTTEGAVLFDAGLQGPEAQARLGHLLLHLVEGLPMGRPSPGDCEAQVDRALAAEARALAVEMRLRRALGNRGHHLPYEFEGAFWGAPPEGREALILAYLRAHPDGAPGLDGLASGYARRCAEAR